MKVMAQDDVKSKKYTSIYKAKLKILNNSTASVADYKIIFSLHLSLDG
jgi:hypothetical protein